MAYDQNVQYLSLAFWQIIMTAGPILAIALGIGLFIGLIQAATSIQEMTLSFVPKLFVVLGAMALFASYTLSTMTDYFMFIFEEIALKGILIGASWKLCGYQYAKYTSISFIVIIIDFEDRVFPFILSFFRIAHGPFTSENCFFIWHWCLGFK